MNNEQIQNSSKTGLNAPPPYPAWIIALTATAGSLFLSQAMQLPPCVLCRYQRIAMCPLVLIIGIGIVTRDSRMKTYALPLILIGLAISVCHNLLYYGVIPESITPCTEERFQHFKADRMARIHHDTADGFYRVRRFGGVPVVL